MTRRSRPDPLFCARARLKFSHRVLVTQVLEEYRPEAASLSLDVFNALQSAVDSLIDEGGYGFMLLTAQLTRPLDEKEGEASLVPLVFLAHLVEELSGKSSFITHIGCERSVIECTSSHTFSEESL